MNLNDIRKTDIGRKKKFRVGRGNSSGIGKQSGRGGKGQTARSGTSFRAYFEGGQMPNIRRLPKRGFNNAQFKTVFALVQVRDLERLFQDGQTVDPEALKAKGLLKHRCDGVKVLGTGELKKKLAVKADAFSKSAAEKITAAGGSVEKI